MFFGCEEEMNGFGSLFGGLPEGYEELNKEEFEVVKGNYKTTITVNFDKTGFPVSHSFMSEYIPSDIEKEINQLELEKKKLVKSQKFEEAAKIRDKIKKLENQLKPTKKGTE